jgi:hypothetical protein
LGGGPRRPLRVWLLRLRKLLLENPSSFPRNCYKRALSQTFFFLNLPKGRFSCKKFCKTTL